MNGGISVYIGLDNSLEENINLIETACNAGIKRIFTSFHIPETDIATFRREAKHTLFVAQDCDMDVISDVSPNTLALLGIESLEPYTMKQMGISTMRVDFGFSAKDIAKMSFSGLKVQLNASTITEELLQELSSYSANFACMDALHNFYPRENTGISEEFFNSKNDLLHRYGIKVGAFVPSYNRPRSPIKAGLPTLEEHRFCNPDFTVRHMIALQVDNIFISDSLPTRNDMICVANLPANQITLCPYFLTDDAAVLHAICQPYRTRLDDAADVYRIDGCRQYCSKYDIDIIPEKMMAREIGAITVDNNLYGRYMGELQIMKKPLPPDRRVNVVGQLSAQEQKLLKYLKPGTPVRLM